MMHKTTNAGNLKKAAGQFLISILLFAGIWFSLSRIDFVKNTTTETIGREAETKLGKLLIKQVDLQYRKSQNDSLQAVIDLVYRQLCDANDIDPSSIDIHVYENTTVNAFVLPDRQIVFFTGLLQHTENAEEFAGVLAHELAHIEKGHAMDRMIKEFGTSLLLTLSGTDGNSGMIANLLRMISTSAFSREQERDADHTAITYLSNSRIDPANLANFLLRLSTMESNRTQIPGWLNTHPDSKDRAAEIIERRENSQTAHPPLYSGDWDELIR